ncbi:MAG: hypothetical protein HYS27_00740 [Deltaproteobacteria bacterium]|nr:hypothetical protein [Deltaproteobacteria bacterium]
MARRPLVLVVGDDAQARALAAALDHAGADGRVVDGTDALSLDERGGVAVCGHDVGSARAVVVRQVPPSPLARSVLLALDDGARLLVHPIAALELHQHKAFAMARLARAGVRVPESLATSDPRAARDFLAHHREVITKPLGGGAPARLLAPEQAAELSLLARAPALLQRRVRGPEHRVYLLAGRVLVAFAVPTDGVVDARERIDEARRVACPTAVRSTALAAARALRLPFCAVDLRTDDDGAAVALDVNPTPSLLDYPDEGVVRARLAAWLVARSRARRGR